MEGEVCKRNEIWTRIDLKRTKSKEGRRNGMKSGIRLILPRWFKCKCWRKGSESSIQWTKSSILFPITTSKRGRERVRERGRERVREREEEKEWEREEERPLTYFVNPFFLFVPIWWLSPRLLFHRFPSVVILISTQEPPFVSIPITYHRLKMGKKEKHWEVSPIIAL